MPKEKIVTVYTIDELDEEAKEKAINEHREINASDEFWFEDYTRIPENGQYKSLFQERAEEKGFDMTAFYFSGFSSQGDGACFEASVDYEEYILKNKLGNRYRVLLNHVRREGGSMSIGCNDRYFSMHEAGYDRFFNASDDSERAWQSAEKADAQAEELADTIVEHARDMAHDFYRTLEKEYEYLTSDEQVTEALEELGHEFTEDGERF